MYSSATEVVLSVLLLSTTITSISLTDCFNADSMDSPTRFSRLYVGIKIEAKGMRVPILFLMKALLRLKQPMTGTASGLRRLRQPVKHFSDPDFDSHGRGPIYLTTDFSDV